MNLPQSGDYIDIHTHGGHPSEGVFLLEDLMAHEDRIPGDLPDEACSYGIHPWNLTEDNFKSLLDRVVSVSGSPNLLAIGEAGFDRLKGPSMELQRSAFTEQVTISESIKKPVIIHCVRAWDELLQAHKKLRPKMPWLIHGFRGNVELAKQFLTKGIYLSFWFDFILRPESAYLIQNLSKNMIFLETDGANVAIKNIYEKVAGDLEMPVDELKAIINANFNTFFKLSTASAGL
jgi:TatD DNase family protein